MMSRARIRDSAAPMLTFSRELTDLAATKSIILLFTTRIVQLREAFILRDEARNFIQHAAYFGH